MPDGKDAPVKHPMTNQIQYFKKTIFPAVFKHKFAWPFHTPVDPVRLGLPDYFDVIKEPMDMSLIKKKLDNFQVLQHALSLFASESLIKTIYSSTNHQKKSFVTSSLCSRIVTLIIDQPKMSQSWQNEFKNFFTQKVKICLQ